MAHERHWLLQSVLAATSIVGALVGVAVLHLAVGGGRMLWPAMVLAALLMAALAWHLSSARQYRAGPMVVALVLVELLLVAVIGWVAYGGMPRLDHFFLSWFGGAGALLAAPWLLGMWLGALHTARRSDRPNPTHRRGRVG